MFQYYRKWEIAVMVLMWLLTIGTGIYVVIMYPDMPEVIPVHFGLWGQPDAWGEKIQIFIPFGIQIVCLFVEQWALHTSVKSSVRSENPTMTNRNCCAVTGLVVIGLFSWCVIGTIWLGRLGKYFVFVTLGVVAIVIISAMISQKKDRERLVELQSREGQRTKKERVDDTLTVQDLRFQGKVAWWMWGILLVIHVFLIWTALAMAGEGKEAWTDTLILVGVMFLMDLLIVPMYVRNYILLGKTELLIVFGFIKKRIAYEHIQMLEETHNPLSSLAMSLDRIYIHTLSGDDVLVSVKEKQAFLQEVNRRIRS